MPAMAGDWPRDPRAVAYGSPQHSAPPAAVRTLPSVAELLSSRPSNSTAHGHGHGQGHGNLYHHQGYFHPRSTPPATSLAAPTAGTAPAAPYWNSANPHQASPPVSPTEQRPLPTASAPRDPAVRVYQEPTLRRQQPSKADPALHYSTPSSGAHIAPHSTGQVRQDSAIDQHRLEADNDTQSSTTHVSYFGQSQKGDQRPSPKLASYQSASITPAYASIIAPLHSEDPPGQAGAHPPPRQHSKSFSSGSPYLAASSKSHEHSTERPIARNGTEPKANITGPSSLPEQFFTQQNNFGTRQQRYNVRFATNYTSENMPSSQKPRNGSHSPPIAPPVVAEPEQPTSPVPIPTSDETLAPSTKANGSSRPTDAQPRPTREARDRSDREPSVERCVGCNEAWRRPIPDMDQGPLAPAENNADYMRLASNMIDRLRDQRKRADAAYEEWKWRHSHCYRPASPHSTGSVEDAARRADPLPQSDGSANGQTTNKRKSEALHDPQSASKQRRVTSTSPAPPVRKPDST